MRTQLKTGSGFKKNKNNWKRTQKSMIIYPVYSLKCEIGLGPLLEAYKKPWAGTPWSEQVRTGLGSENRKYNSKKTVKKSLLCKSYV